MNKNQSASSVKQKNIQKKKTQKVNNPLRSVQGPSQRSIRDTSLSLTRSQFTATSPQNYWEFSRASTPGGLRVRGRELISSTTAATALTGAFAQLNLQGGGPGLFLIPLNFPRLGTIAAAFAEYIFHSVNVCFQANQATTETGEVLLCLDYDAAQPAPTTSISMMAKISSTMANIYSDACCQGLKSLSRLPRYNVQNGESGTNALQTCQFILYVAAEGVTATALTTLGYVAVEYDVEFFSPTI